MILKLTRALLIAVAICAVYCAGYVRGMEDGIEIRKKHCEELMTETWEGLMKHMQENPAPRQFAL